MCVYHVAHSGGGRDKSLEQTLTDKYSEALHGPTEGAKPLCTNDSLTHCYGSHKHSHNLHQCVNTHTCAHAHTHTYTHTHAHVQTCMHACTHAPRHTHASMPHMYTTHTHAHVHVHAHACTHTQIVYICLADA